MANSGTIDAEAESIPESAMDLARVEAFLVVAEELHFGRAAERMYTSQPRVSRLVASLEHEVGGMLFERTSRRVRLTPLGVRLRERLAPSYQLMRDALADATAVARDTTGTLRVGFTAATTGAALTRLVDTFEARHPDCAITLREIDMWDPYTPLRADEIDVLVNWLVVDEPDLVVGPVIEHRNRVLAVSAAHPLARQRSVCVEDLARHEVIAFPPSFPRALAEALSPLTTPSGKAIPRAPHTNLPYSIGEVLSLIAVGRIVHPTIASVALFHREDIALIPIRDLPPFALGLIWSRAHENARIRDLAAASLSPSAPR
jgi:DNA-binding transcriptional LysR family regulator